MIGAGAIGSLFAGHLAQVVDVSVLTRRRDHAEALERDGLRVTGRSDLHARVTATPDPDELEPFDLGIVATKANGLEDAAASLEGRFPDAMLMTTLNGLGAEEVVRAHGDWPLVSAVTFMSGTKHSDTEVEYILDTATWMGPYEDTPFDRVEEIGDLVRRAGPRGGGVRRPASRAVVEADLQRDGQLRRRAHRPSPRPALRGGGDAGRPRPPRPRPRRRGQGGRGRGRDRALRGPVGDERARDASRVGSLSVDAGGRRSTQGDRDRPHHRLTRPRGGATWRPGAVAHGAVPPRQGEGGIVD